MIDKEIKQHNIVLNFVEEIKSKREPHTILFVGGDSLFAEKMMNTFAQAILCESLCDDCLNCKKMLSGNHPDVMYFPSKNQLLVEDSNKISNESFVRPIFADKKIFVIKNFDKSTAEAQNKLLKIFEEPMPNVYYLLSTTNIEKVLPTIRSRCFKINLPVLSKKEIESEIIASCDKELVLELGKGNLGKTIELSRKKDLEETFAIVKSVFSDMKNSKQVVVFANKILAKKENFGLIIEMFCQILEDLLAKICKREELIVLKSQKNFFETIASEYSIKSVCEIEKLIRKLQEERFFNVNLPAIVDNLLLGILEVKYLCK